jgi:hypothetical protein
MRLKLKKDISPEVAVQLGSSSQSDLDEGLLLGFLLLIPNF